jgi:hypothetical protein
MTTRGSLEAVGAPGGAAIVMALVLALWVASPAPAHAAGEAAGTTAAGFLSLGTGAGVLGRAGATLGLTGDLAIVPWNPAALGWLGETQIAVSDAQLADEARQDWAAVGGRLGRSSLRWSLDGLYQTEGSFDGRDALDNSTGAFDVSSMAVGLHLAHPLGPIATLGVGGKYVGEKLGAVSGTGYTMDAGLQVRAGLLGVGVAATNLGGAMSYGGSRYDLPTNVGVGAALDVPLTGIRLAVDANFPRSYYDDVRVGAEWRWHDLMALRAGYRRELDAPADLAESGPSFGAGAGLHGLWLDYGYVVPGAGAGQHRLSITLKPGKFGWLAGDPFGQKAMPREFDDSHAAAPSDPAPSSGSARRDAPAGTKGDSTPKK